MKLKKRRFKLVEFIGRFQGIEETESWVRDRLDAHQIRQVKAFTPDHFEKKLKEILFYRITRLFFQEIDRALAGRAHQYTKKMAGDVLSFAGSSFALKPASLERRTNEILPKVESAMSKLWSDPGLMFPAGFKYRTTFNNLVRLASLDAEAKKKMRDRIKITFYVDLERIRKIFFIRHEKRRKARTEYELFVTRHVLADLELSNFVRDGKYNAKDFSVTIDFRSFQRSQSRFMKNHKKVRQ